MNLAEAGKVIDQAIAEIEALRTDRAKLWAAIQDLRVAWEIGKMPASDAIERLIALQKQQTRGKR